MSARSNKQNKNKMKKLQVAEMKLPVKELHMSNKLVEMPCDRPRHALIAPLRGCSSINNLVGSFQEEKGTYGAGLCSVDILKRSVVCYRRLRM